MSPENPENSQENLFIEHKGKITDVIQEGLNKNTSTDSAYAQPLLKEIANELANEFIQMRVKPKGDPLFDLYTNAVVGIMVMIITGDKRNYFLDSTRHHEVDSQLIMRFFALGIINEAKAEVDKKPRNYKSIANIFTIEADEAKMLSEKSNTKRLWPNDALNPESFSDTDLIVLSITKLLTFYEGSLDINRYVEVGAEFIKKMQDEPLGLDIELIRQAMNAWHPSAEPESRDFFMPEIIGYIALGLHAAIEEKIKKEKEQK